MAKQYPTATQGNKDPLAAPTDFTKLGGYTANDSASTRPADNKKDKEEVKDLKHSDIVKTYDDESAKYDDDAGFHAPHYSGNGYEGAATAEPWLNKDYVQKKLVQEAMLDINFDDLQNLLESTSDDKEFVTQALDIFKATINTVLEDSIDKVASAAVEIIQEEATAGIEEKIDELESQYNEFMEDLDANISDYIDAMVLEWYEDNKLAIQDSTKTSIAESFMSELKNLMVAYSVEVPEESADLYEASLQTGQQLFDEYSELKSAYDDAISQLDNLNKYVVAEAFISESDLTVMESEKLRRVAQTLDFKGETDFVNKLAVIAESYQSAPRTYNQLDENDYAYDSANTVDLYEDTYDYSDDYADEYTVSEEVEDLQESKQAPKQTIDPLVAAIAARLR